MLTRKHPPHYFAIVDEAVLHRPFGGRKVMAEQIRRIIELAELPNVTVQVLPFYRGGYPIYGPFLLFLEPAGTSEFLAAVAAEYNRE